MSAPPSPANSATAAITELEVDAVLEEAGGDPREAIRMLLHDLASLAMDADAATSRGYVRGRFTVGLRLHRVVRGE